MFPSSFARVLEGLSASFVKAQHAQVLEPFALKDKTTKNNKIIKVHQGNVYIRTGKKEALLSPEKIYFLSPKTSGIVTFGNEPTAILNDQELKRNANKYLKSVPLGASLANSDAIIFSSVDFTTKVHSTIDLFHFLQIPSFKIENEARLNNWLVSILEEAQHELPGKKQILNNSMSGFVINLLRAMVDKRMFLQKIGLRMEALTDPRLISIFDYVQRNLSASLSNTSISKQAGCSSEYISQLFTKKIGINLQQYVKQTRITEAIELLTRTSCSIRAVSKKVGILNFSYFCRAFKKVMGINPNKLRQRFKRN